MLLAVYFLIALAAVAATALLSDAGVAILILLFFICFIGIVGLHFLVLFVTSRFIDPEHLPEKIKPFHRFLTLSTIGMMLAVMRVRVTVRGKELLPDEPMLFISNHFSVYDPMIAMLHLRKHKLAFVSKKENIQIPMAGRFMLASGCVSLDRSSAKKAALAINKAAENISTGRCSMGIYPEGGTNRDPERVLLRPFKSGSFRLALRSKAPIAIAVMSNTRKINKQLFTHVTMDIIRVISYDEYKDMKTNELSELTYNIMKEWLSR
ncbi:MAG: 1-acyl-sn-glycerol-3-phosphate acyltransferase [Ruminococcaceae bacterium]|nr:1-acyl-sn-glycerol-3-phosphate acyltransferase [Oscillospiraceae bacterium]